jgi:hypothetical protein
MDGRAAQWAPWISDKTSLVKIAKYSPCHCTLIWYWCCKMHLVNIRHHCCLHLFILKFNLFHHWKQNGGNVWTCKIIKNIMWNLINITVVKHASFAVFESMYLVAHRVRKSFLRAILIWRQLLITQAGLQMLCGILGRLNFA